MWIDGEYFLDPFEEFRLKKLADVIINTADAAIRAIKEHGAVGATMASDFMSDRVRAQIVAIMCQQMPGRYKSCGPLIANLPDGEVVLTNTRLR